MDSKYIKHIGSKIQIDFEKYLFDSIVLNSRRAEAPYLGEQYIDTCNYEDVIYYIENQ